tara:strand:+ start:581 stop:943 length:363 start_codon:yes stop_codon:yes gene_type:complete
MTAAHEVLFSAIDQLWRSDDESQRSQAVELLMGLPSKDRSIMLMSLANKTIHREEKHTALLPHMREEEGWRRESVVTIARLLGVTVDRIITDEPTTISLAYLIGALLELNPLSRCSYRSH